MKIKANNVMKEFESGANLFEIAKSFDEEGFRAFLLAKVNGKTEDLSTVLTADAEVEFLTFESEEGKKAYRHTASHVLAQAVKRLYPTVKVAIGPAIENGFYYDFEFDTTVTIEAIPAIEAEMKKIIKENFRLERTVVSKQKALEIFYNEPYKKELIENLPADAEISLYKQGDFVDLCAGPHIPSTGKIKAYKLTSVTGAYWRGDEKNKMLTRIYGTAFDTKENLEAYLAAIEDAKKRDHNKLGRELGIFMTDENIGQGLPLLMPKGAKLFQILSRFVEDEEERRGYLLTKTPYMSKNNLFKISGHWDHYKDKMFIMQKEEDNDEVLALRPMTCPFQYTIYNNGLKSYRDLPIRYSETSTLYRKEASGEMHGLIRIRQFTLGEGHIICMPEQVEKEFTEVLNLNYYMLSSLGLMDDVSFRFSRWDPNDVDKYINDPEAWEATESSMKTILDHLKLNYVEGIGEAAFYGPKLDIQIKNVHGKEDTLMTIQIDFLLGERFNMNYVDANGEKKHPIIIHRSSIGCYERTMALLIEKYAGAFPVWFAPLQVKVMSLTSRTEDNAKAIVDNLRMKGIRAEADVRGEKLGFKIREAQQYDKVPYILVVGDKEAADNTVSVRSRKSGDMGVMTLDDFYAIIRKEIDDKVVK